MVFKTEMIRTLQLDKYVPITHKHHIRIAFMAVRWLYDGYTVCGG